MSFFDRTAQSLSPYTLLLTRVLVGYMFLLHGTSKFFEIPVSLTGGNGAVPLLSLAGVSGVLEIVGGILLILGLFTRFTAFILAGHMAVAYFMVHAAGGVIFDPLTNKGESAALFSMAFLLLWTTGPGKFSLDAKLGRSV